MEKLAELARQIREQAERSQEAQAVVDRMMAERRRVEAETERAWREREAREREQG